MRRSLLLLAVVLPGAAAVAVCGRYLMLDWSALAAAFTRFERLEHDGADLRSLFVAHAYEQTYRINCFADGVGLMLGAVLTAIGLHGLCAPEPGSARSDGTVRREAVGEQVT
jgi:hypothetical protein